VGKIRRLIPGLLAALIVAAGCDGQDPERLSRVGKKLAEKGRKLADDTQLPKVEVTYPKLEPDKGEKGKSSKEPAPTASTK
jgi:hypothetical protein